MRWVGWAFVTLCLSTVAVAQPATDETATEEPSPEDRLSEARSAFEQGVNAFRDGRPADARRAFRRSIELFPTPVAAWNLSRSMLRVGDPLKALQTVRAMLDEEFGELDAEQRAAAIELRAEILASLALLRIVSNEDVSLNVMLDATGLGELPPRSSLERRVVPGEHVVRATAADARQANHRVELTAGATLDVRLVLEEVEPPQSRNRTALVLGVVAGVLVAGAVALTVGLVVSNDTSAEVDPIWGNIEALRSPAF